MSPGAAMKRRSATWCEGSTRQALLNVSNPDWFVPYLSTKNTFLEASPPLAESATGFRALRRQTSDPSFDIVGQSIGRPASGESWLEQLRGLYCQGGKHAKRGPSLDEGSDTTANAASNTTDHPENSGVLEEPGIVPEKPGTGPAPEKKGAVSEQPDPMPDKQGRARKQPGHSDEDRDVVGGKKVQRRNLRRQQVARQLQAEGHELDTVLAAIPLDEGLSKTSFGSLLHATGNCRPCAFAMSREGCEVGDLCRFCHFQHTKPIKVRVRPCKGKRDRYRKLLGKLMAKVETSECDFDFQTENLPAFLQYDPQLKEKLVRNLTQHIEQIRAA